MSDELAVVRAEVSAYRAEVDALRAELAALRAEVAAVRANVRPTATAPKSGPPRSARWEAAAKVAKAHPEIFSAKPESGGTT